MFFLNFFFFINEKLQLSSRPRIIHNVLLLKYIRTESLKSTKIWNKFSWTENLLGANSAKFSGSFFSLRYRWVTTWMPNRCAGHAPLRSQYGYESPPHYGRSSEEWDKRGEFSSLSPHSKFFFGKNNNLFKAFLFLHLQLFFDCPVQPAWSSAMFMASSLPVFIFLLSLPHGLTFNCTNSGVCIEKMKQHRTEYLKVSIIWSCKIIQAYPDLTKLY